MPNWMGNWWANDVPLGATAVENELRIVNLCIYRLPNVSIPDDTIKDILKKAGTIWCQCFITVISNINPQDLKEDGDRKSGDLTFIDDANTIPLVAERLQAGGTPNPWDSIQKKVSNQLTRDYNRPGCTPTDVAVYFIQGTHFKDGATSTTVFENGKIFIVMPQGNYTNPDSIEVMGSVLAHELGHALFLRKNSSGNFVMDNPDIPHQVPNDVAHDDRPDNLMHYPVIRHPNISQPQCQQAQKSQFVKFADVLVAYKPAPKCTKIKVDFLNYKCIAIHNSGAFPSSSDKVRPHFSVGTTQGEQVKNWDEDNLQSGNTYDLTLPGVLQPGPPSFIVDVKNTLSVDFHVWGTIVHTWSDDQFPEWHDSVTESENWRIGNHHQPLNNDWIKSELEYTISCIETEQPDTVKLDGVFCFM